MLLIKTIYNNDTRFITVKLGGSNRHSQHRGWQCGQLDWWSGSEDGVPEERYGYLLHNN